MIKSILKLPKHLQMETTKRSHKKGHDNDKPIDINALIENDPRLLKLKPGTPEYRDELKITFRI